MSAEKEINLLQEQIDKLQSKDFDLQAWKKYTIILLARIFGDTSQKVRQIENIEYDYSSWALRDSSGKTSYLETCRKLGREILEASIEELRNFGVPEHSKKADEVTAAVLTALQDELKGSQYKEVVAILESGDKPEEKKKKILEKLKSYSSDTPVTILADILTSPFMIHQFYK